MADNTPTTTTGESKLTLESLRSNLDSSVLTLGSVAVAELLENGVVSLYVGESGQIELAAPGELGLDALPEEQAIQELLSQQVSEEEIALYLKGRDARLSYSLLHNSMGSSSNG